MKRTPTREQMIAALMRLGAPRAEAESMVRRARSRDRATKREALIEMESWGRVAAYRGPS